MQYYKYSINGRIMYFMPNSISLYTDLLYICTTVIYHRIKCVVIYSYYLKINCKEYLR